MSSERPRCHWGDVWSIGPCVWWSFFTGYSQRWDFHPNTCWEQPCVQRQHPLKNTPMKPFQVAESGIWNNSKLDGVSLGLAFSNCGSYFSIYRAKEPPEPSPRQLRVCALPQLGMQKAMLGAAWHRNPRWKAARSVSRSHIRCAGSEG